MKRRRAVAAHMYQKILAIPPIAIPRAADSHKLVLQAQEVLFRSACTPIHFERVGPSGTNVYAVAFAGPFSCCGCCMAARLMASCLQSEQRQHKSGIKVLHCVKNL